MRSPLPILPSTLIALSSISAVFAGVDLIPGVILILVVAAITGWSAHVIGHFKRAHPQCHSIADMGEMWWGPVGREVFGGIYWVCE